MRLTNDIKTCLDIDVRVCHFDQILDRVDTATFGRQVETRHAILTLKITPNHMTNIAHINVTERHLVHILLFRKHVIPVTIAVNHICQHHSYFGLFYKFLQHFLSYSLPVTECFSSARSTKIKK